MKSLGRFVRFDLMTPEEAACRAFYGALLGWQFRTAGAGPFTTTIIEAGGRDLGWVVPFHVPGHPAHFVGYVAVNDVDVACQRASAAGGTVCVPPHDLPGSRFAVLEDPTGALFSPYQTATPIERDAPPAVGDVCWVQLLSRDAEAARAFYQRLLGWHHAPLPTGQPGALFMAGGAPFAGVLQKPADADPGTRDGWLPYFLVEDVAERTAAAAALGATVHVPASEIPAMGTFSVLADPAGAVFALWQNA